MRQVSELKPEWLVEIAPHYYQLKDVENLASKKMPRGPLVCLLISLFCTSFVEHILSLVDLEHKREAPAVENPELAS
nr:pre-mRNA-splicing factor ATP-dependent RNA helicase DEAH1-like isoform X1 [Tanacetum cinerariifolium]